MFVQPIEGIYQLETSVQLQPSLQQQLLLLLLSQQRLVQQLLILSPRPRGNFVGTYAAVSTPQVEAFNQPPAYAATPEPTRPHGSAPQETADLSFLNAPNRHSG